MRAALLADRRGGISGNRRELVASIINVTDGGASRSARNGMAGADTGASQTTMSLVQ